MQFKAKDFTPRTAETYDYHCSLLDGPLSAEDSITYGINYESPLNEIENFHVINQLPQDIMHVLLEGVIPYEISLLLTKFLVYQSIFQLTISTTALRAFCTPSKRLGINHLLLKGAYLRQDILS